MKKDYKAEIIRIVSETDNTAIIASIYSFIIGLLYMRKGGAS